MKKRIAIILAIICVLTIGLCACDKGSSGGSAGGKSETVDVGDFTVNAPKNWMVLEQTDMFGEKDAEGNYPKRTDAIGLIKDGKSEFDAFSKPVLYIYYYSSTTASEQAESTKAWSIGDIIDKDPVTINGKECQVLEEKQESIVDEGKYYIYNYVFYPITDTGCIQFTVPIDMIEFAGVSIEDADVKAIMESVQLK